MKPLHSTRWIAALAALSLALCVGRLPQLRGLVSHSVAAVQKPVAPRGIKGLERKPERPRHRTIESALDARFRRHVRIFNGREGDLENDGGAVQLLLVGPPEGGATRRVYARRSGDEWTIVSDEDGYWAGAFVAGAHSVVVGLTSNVTPPSAAATDRGARGYVSYYYSFYLTSPGAAPRAISYALRSEYIDDFSWGSLTSTSRDFGMLRFEGLSDGQIAVISQRNGRVRSKILAVDWGTESIYFASPWRRGLPSRRGAATATRVVVGSGCAFGMLLPRQLRATPDGPENGALVTLNATVEVLGRTDIHRGNEALFHVRLFEGGATGYLFLDEERFCAFTE